MVIWPAFHIGQYRVNGHRYHAPQFRAEISRFEILKLRTGTTTLKNHFLQKLYFQFVWHVEAIVQFNSQLGSPKDDLLGSLTWPVDRILSIQTLFRIQNFLIFLKFYIDLFFSFIITKWHQKWQLNVWTQPVHAQEALVNVMGNCLLIFGI